MKNIILILTIFATLNVLAQPAGSLDPSFGNGGKVVTSITSGQDKSYGVSIQTDGKIVVAGYSTSTVTGKDFTVVRYNSDGSLDDTFGNNGVVTTDLQTGSDDIAYSIAIQTDGKIILAGYSDNGSNKDAALVRYNNDGSLDNTFGNNGVVLTDFENSQQDEIKVVKIHQLTGNIIVGGSSVISTYVGKPVVARYLTDGTLDNTFNSNGIKTLWIRASDDTKLFSVEDLIVESNGKISAAGWQRSLTPAIQNEYWAARILSNGDMDITFSQDGVVNYYDGSSMSYGLLLNNNKDFILCGAKQYIQDSYLRTFKINNNGNIPSAPQSYSGYGLNGYHKAYKIVEDMNGKYVMVGASGSSSTNQSFLVGRLNTNLSVDNSFITTGFTTVSFGNNLNEAFGVAVQTDNKIIAVGYSGNNFAIARYLGDITPNLNDFQLILPANLSTNQNFANLSFDWSDAFGATSYEIDIDVSPTFSSPQTFSSSTSAYTVTNLLPNTQYYWRVRASAGGNWGTYSNVWSFTTNSLENFNLISPANNSINQNFASLSFDWSDVLGASSYEIDIDVSQTFSSAQTFTSSTSNYTKNNLLPNTQYYWRVRASNGTNWGAYSNVWSFTTNSLENFNLISPANGSINQQYSSLVLDWSDNIGAVNYELQIDTTQGFITSPLTYTTSNSTYTVSLLPSKTYYWKVRATNGATWGQWSTVWSFKTKADPFSSINEVYFANLKIYPNPTSDKITLETNTHLLNKPFKLLDYTGREVYSSIINSEQTIIKLDGLSSGTYLLQIGDYPQRTFKLLKE